MRRLVILDDFIPNLLSAFRVVEYNAYLTAFDNAIVVSSVGNFQEHLSLYLDRYPGAAGRIVDRQSFDFRADDFVFLNFLNNAASALEVINRHELSFGFCLYPGGGFGFGEYRSNAALDKIVESPCLRFIIVTQPIVGDFIKRRYGKSTPKLVEIFGAPVMHPEGYDIAAQQRAYYGCGKDTLDLCFVANRYSSTGEDKGFPLFIEACILIAAGDPKAQFHVVGDWPKTAIPASLNDRVKFYGTLLDSNLKDLFLGMDMVISPNKPFVLHGGSFDGFPTASCVEASLGGALMLVSDPLEMNRYYEPGKELILTGLSATAIADSVKRISRAGLHLKKIAQAGRKKSMQLFSPKAQISPRLEIMKLNLQQ